ncbi:MAG: insulinase family protein [Ignavibacteriales bacterium]|nr:insulinase family protein [Ignavibacteriales bacterium]
MNTTRWILIFTLLVAAVQIQLGQKQKPPEGETPKDFTLPSKQAVTLKNGLSLTLVPYGALPKVTVSIVIRAGNVNEEANEVWLADLVGDLMKEGTASRSAQQIAEEAAGMGGSVNIGVGPDQTSIRGDVLSEFGPKLVSLLADIVRNPLFPESELPRLKNDQIRQLTVAKSQPRQLTMEQFHKILYGEHPYGRIFPTESMLQSYTIEKVRDFFEKNFGAGRTSIYVVGRFDDRAMEKAVRDAFETWQKGPHPLVNIPKTSARRAFHLIDRPGAPQSTIYLGLPVINPAEKNYVPLLVTNALLGGSFGSRITSNIREQKGYTYSPSSTVSVRYRDAYWVQVADVTTESTGPALEEIFKEIDRLQAEPPSTEELKGIQNYLSGTFVLQNSSRGGIIGQLSFLRLHGLGDDYLSNYVQNVHSVTPQQVSEITRRQIRDEKMILVITGDKKMIEKQIEEYARIAPE